MDDKVAVAGGAANAAGETKGHKWHRHHRIRNAVMSCLSLIRGQPQQAGTAYTSIRLTARPTMTVGEFVKIGVTQSGRVGHGGKTQRAIDLFSEARSQHNW